MNARVTQGDIARAAGVHNATVSLSLRNSPLIPPATRERIQQVARALGYTPDPALCALAAYRNRRGRRRPAEALAYISARDPRQPDAPPDAYFNFAARRAHELGFAFKPLWLGEAGLTPRRLDRQLVHEGIRCVLLGPRLPAVESLDAIDWSRLCAVRIGQRGPELNQVALDAGAVVRLAFNQVLLTGRRRIGLVLAREDDACAGHAWSAAFHGEQYRHQLDGSLPPLFLPGAATPADAAPLLAGWHRRHRPDVVLSLTSGVHHLLRRSGVAVPESVAYAELLLQDVLGTIAGVRAHEPQLGELAVTMLAAQLEKNQFGLPAAPTVTSLAGRWFPGASLPTRLPLPAPVELRPSILPANLVA